MPANVGGFELELIAHIEQKEILASIEPLASGLQLEFQERPLSSPLRSCSANPSGRTRLDFSPKIENPPASSISGGGSD
jgi:hypothetical protein